MSYAKKYANNIAMAKNNFSCKQDAPTEYLFGIACPFDHGSSCLPHLQEQQQGAEPPGNGPRTELALSELTQVDARREKVLITHTPSTRYGHFL